MEFRKACRFCYQNRQGITARERSSIETLNNRTIDGEPRATERRSARTGDQTVLHEREDLEFLAQLPTIALLDRLSRPCVQLSVPCRAVIESDRRDAAENIVWPMPIGQIRRQTLPQRVVAGSGFRSVGRDKDAFDRTCEGIVVAQQQLSHQRSIRIVFDG